MSIIIRNANLESKVKAIANTRKLATLSRTAEELLSERITELEVTDRLTREHRTVRSSKRVRSA